MKIYKADYIFWTLLLITGAGWYLSNFNGGWAIIFYILLSFYVILSFVMRAIILKSIKENQGITELSNIRVPQYDTATWIEARGIIISFYTLGKVMESGKEVGRLFNFLVQIDSNNGGRWRTYIKNYVLPASHLNSFGINTEIMVLYNPEKKLKEIIFDPNQKPWHYDKSKTLKS